MATERYTKEELLTIKKFLEDAKDYENKCRKHWVKEASKKEDEAVFLRLALQSQERVEAVKTYEGYVDSSLDFINSKNYEATVLFVK